MKYRIALALSLTCAIAGGAPALAAAAIAPRSLVAHPADLPGFTSAKPKLRSATSPSRYARVVLGERSREARSEVARLKRQGFREGVEELFSGAQGEALSFALVLGSAAAARQELQHSKREALKAEVTAVIERYSVPAVPGAFAFSAVEAGHPSAVANVLFATGRCFLLVGDSLRDADSEQAAAAPLAGATALSRRVRGLCAER